jgi:hypothetical protein
MARARAVVIGPRWLGALAVLLVALGGCAGRDFARPPADSLSLGKTTEREIRQRFGDPYRQGTVLRNGETMTTLTYAYAAGAGSLAGGLTPSRGIGFYFWNDVMVGHEFTSSFEEDKTDFDVTKVPQIRKGETTETAVTTLLGPAPGGYIYPMIADKTARALVYLYTQTRGSAFGLKHYQQMLVITIAPTGVVSDVQLTTSGER